MNNETIIAYRDPLSAWWWSLYYQYPEWFAVGIVILAIWTMLILWRSKE